MYSVFIKYCVFFQEFSTVCQGGVAVNCEKKPPSMWALDHSLSLVNPQKRVLTSRKLSFAVLLTDLPYK